MDKLTILIVEDEENLARTLAQALRLGSDGLYMVDACHSAEEAAPLLAANQYQLVISDYKLPGKNGLDLVEAIKADAPNTQTILITGYDSEALEAQADRLTEGYLIKPFDMLDLMMMVEKVVAPGEAHAGQAIKQGDLEENNRHHILILEDDYGLRRIFAKALRKAGYQVDEAPTLQASRTLLDENDYEIFICDIQIGRERGLDLLDVYQEKFTAAGTQVVMCSAYGQYRNQTEAMGIDYFLEKPISLSTLLTLVNRLVTAESEETNA